MSYIAPYYGKFAPVKRDGIPDYAPESEALERWLVEQENYFMKGYDAGGDHITGEQYFMLNFGTNLMLDENKDKVKSTPYYVDAHREIFDAREECRRTGENLFVAKARDKGFTDIIVHVSLFNCMMFDLRETLAIFPAGASIAADTFKKKYNLAWTNLYPYFRYYPGIKNDSQFKIYGRFDVNGEQIGRQSTLVTLKGFDADIAKSGRFKDIFIDEIGEIEAPLNIVRTNEANQREGGTKFGFHTLGGTSNAVNASGYVDFCKLTNEHKDMGFKFIFIPAQKIYWGHDPKTGKSYIDPETGISDEEAAILDVKERGKGLDGEELMIYQQNYPTNIKEMLMSINGSPFSADKIATQKAYIATDKTIQEQIQQGELYYDIGSGEVKFRLNKKGKWKIFRHRNPNPFSPDVIATDSYRLQDVEKSAKMSKGAIIVRRPWQGILDHGAKTIAIMVDRPDDKEEFFQECIKAEKYWNCKNLIEHTDSDIIRYHEEHGAAKFMYHCPTVLDDIGTHSKSKPKYGIKPSPAAMHKAVEVAITEFNTTWQNEVFVEVLDDLLNYTVKNIDLGMAYVWSTVHALDMVTNKPRVVARARQFTSYITTIGGKRVVVNTLRMDKALNPQKYKAA